MKYVSTVCGQIESSKMGFVYPHEHSYTYLPHKDGSFTYVVTDYDKVQKELIELHNAGVDTFVDATAIGMGRNVDFMRALSLTTGINIICSTGFYRDEFIPDYIRNVSDDKVYDIVMSEINEGIACTGIKPGMIKFAVSKDKITDEEFRIGKILCRVQKETNLPLYTHCTDGTCAPEIANYLLNNGAIKEKLTIGHVDVPKDKDYLEGLCKLGINVSLDKFGRDIEGEDEDKVNIVMYLIEKGYIDQLFIGGDMGNTKYLHSYNGEPGFTFIKEHIVPKLLRKGLSQAQIDKLFKENPVRLFAR